MAKGRAFFEKAHKAGESDNYDYAIEMYLEGLRVNPEEVTDGHIRLRALAHSAKGKGREKAVNDGKSQGDSASARAAAPRTIVKRRIPFHKRPRPPSLCRIDAEGRRGRQL